MTNRFPEMRSGDLDINLRLERINDLFEKPTTSPFAETYQPHSTQPGIEYVLGELYANRSAANVRLTILLPPEQISPDLARHVEQAVRRYAEARIQQGRNATQKLLYQGIRTLPLALAGFGILIASLPLISEESFLASVAGNGLMVAGWVLLWFPLDALIFQWWIDRHEQHVYRRLQEIAVLVEPVR